MIVGDLVDAGVAEIRTGPFGTQLKASDYVETGRPVLNVRNVGFGEVRAENLEYIDEQTADRLSGHLLQSGDIVFGRKGAVERHAFITSDFVGALQGSDCIRLRLRESAPIRAQFASFALRTAEHQAWMRAFCSHGATMASLNQDILRQVRLPDLPLAAQDAVIGLLGSIDDLIENNRRRVEVLEEMARAIYREWFVRFRYPGHEDVPLVDSPLGLIPDGWTVSTCGDELTALGGGTPSKKDPAFWEGGTIPWFTPSDLTKSKQRYAGEPELRITSEGLARSSARLFPQGSVLMTSRATLGVLAMATFDATTNQGFIVIPPDDRWSPSFIFEWLDFHADALAAVATGATFKEITKGAFKRLPFLVPGQDVLDAHREAVEPIESEIRVLEEQTLALGHLRDLLLPKLVTGQIDVSHLNLDALTEAATA